MWTLWNLPLLQRVVRQSGIQLCSALVIGGLSPSQALYQKIREQVDIPIRVLLRPRFGDFCYTDFEHEILKEEIRSFRKLGADGIVIGTMKPDGTLNLEQMKELMEVSPGDASHLTPGI